MNELKTEIVLEYVRITNIAILAKNIFKKYHVGIILRKDHEQVNGLLRCCKNALKNKNQMIYGDAREPYGLLKTRDGDEDEFLKKRSQFKGSVLLSCSSSIKPLVVLPDALSEASDAEIHSMVYAGMYCHVCINLHYFPKNLNFDERITPYVNSLMISEKKGEKIGYKASADVFSKFRKEGKTVASKFLGSYQHEK